MLLKLQQPEYLHFTIKLFLKSDCLYFLGIYKLGEFNDKVEGYHANRTTNLMFCTTSKTEGEVGAVKLV